MSFCNGLCATTKSIASLYRDRNRLPQPLSLDSCGRETGFVEIRPTDHRAAPPRPGHACRSVLHYSWLDSVASALRKQVPCFPASSCRPRPRRLARQERLGLRGHLPLRLPPAFCLAEHLPMDVVRVHESICAKGLAGPDSQARFPGYPLDADISHEVFSYRRENSDNVPPR